MFIFCSCLFCLFISFFSHLKSWAVFSISMSLTLKICSFPKLVFSTSIKPWTPFRLTLQDSSSNSSPKYSSTSISYWLKILRWTKILATISSSMENWHIQVDLSFDFPFPFPLPIKPNWLYYLQSWKIANFYFFNTSRFFFLPNLWPII